MVEHLTNLFPRLALHAGILVMLQGAGACALAQALVDPTRPPDALNQEAQTAGKAQPAASGPVLQSVLISPRRVVAIISGETVRPGDKYGDARVVRITEGEVVLRTGNQLQTLKLFPDIEKLPASGHAGSRRDSRRKTND